MREVLYCVSWQREADCLKFVKGESLGAESHNQVTAADGFAVALCITSPTECTVGHRDVWTSVN